MFNVGSGEMLVIFLLALVVLGPDKLPEAAKKLGKVMGDLRKMSSGFQQEMKQAMDVDGIKQSLTGTSGPTLPPLSSESGDSSPSRPAPGSPATEIAASAPGPTTPASAPDLKSVPNQSPSSDSSAKGEQGAA